MSGNESNHDEGWGWEALGSEDDVVDNSDAPHSPLHHIKDEADHSPHHHEKVGGIGKSSSDRSLVNRKGMSSTSSSSLKGITSSPSFQELEKAIGVALSQTSVEGDGGDGRTTTNSMSASKLSSTNLTQQKILQQRMRQHYHSYGPRGISIPIYKHSNSLHATISARSELAPFLNESESRALIIFHSQNISQNVIREACSKYGVLYYIRPEFHLKGVTFISYFDLQAATAAKDSISEALGSDSEISAHYSIMLHATTNNTEEYRLVVRNLPDQASESEVQSIFARYGPLRSIQKTFGSGSDLSGQSVQQNVNIAYTIEYYNIQDARLAASELSATSGSIWGPDAIVKFAPLDERKQQLCRQLLSTLSRWRTEMASMVSMHPSGGSSSIPQTIHLAPMQPILHALPVHIIGNNQQNVAFHNNQYPNMQQLIDISPAPLSSGFNNSPILLPPAHIGGMYSNGFQRPVTHQGQASYYGYMSEMIHNSADTSYPVQNFTNVIDASGNVMKDSNVESPVMKSYNNSSDSTLPQDNLSFSER